MAVLINTNKLDHAYRYAEDIKSGKILACKWIKLAVDRFYDDLKHGPQRGIIFDEDAASTRLKAFDFINIKKNITIKSRTGREIRKAQYEPFMLEGWQSWISANEYGFYYDTGERRFNTSIKCMARKNGKTTFGSAEGIIALLFDGEIEAQVYCAATKKDQARILFKEAKKMINISPLLKQFFEKENLTKDSIYDPTTDSYFQPVSSDSNTLDGLNPHKVLLDELHEYKRFWSLRRIRFGHGRKTAPAFKYAYHCRLSQRLFLLYFPPKLPPNIRGHHKRRFYFCSILHPRF
jgi:phage terminase large subunit-like protein